MTLAVGTSRIEGFDADQWNRTFLAAGYDPSDAGPDTQDSWRSPPISNVDWFMAELIPVLVVIYVTVVYR